MAALLDGTPWRQALKPGSLIGEATASYAVLDDDIICDICTINPEIKVLLTLRDPVSRAWSHAKKDLLTIPRRSLGEVGSKAFFDFYEDEYQLACGRYSTIVPKWEIRLRDGHLFVGSYEAMCRNPRGYFMSVCGFLGIDASKNGSGELEHVVNPSKRESLPTAHEQKLVEVFGKEREFIGDYLGGREFRIVGFR